jgi:hypothetical protein
MHNAQCKNIKLLLLLLLLLPFSFLWFSFRRYLSLEPVVHPTTQVQVSDRSTSLMMCDVSMAAFCRQYIKLISDYYVLYYCFLLHPNIGIPSLNVTI